MVAFKTESWIWYSVVWVIAISRLSVSQTQAYAHMHEAQFSPVQPSPMHNAHSKPVATRAGPDTED
jgi:hypothetical protein